MDRAKHRFSANRAVLLRQIAARPHAPAGGDDQGDGLRHWRSPFADFSCDVCRLVTHTLQCNTFGLQFSRDLTNMWAIETLPKEYAEL